jgi:uncharacterized membrane protein
MFIAEEGIIMLGFLPLEKIPIFVWGLVLLVVAIFLALHEDPFSQGQVVNAGVAVVGGAAFIYDVKKRCRRRKSDQLK